MVAILAPKLKGKPSMVPLSKKGSIEDCNILLTNLPEGIYSMDWHGPFPKFHIHNPDNTDSGIIEITVQSKSRFKEIMQFKKSFSGKKIEICENDVSCIESWTQEQVSQLITRLKDIINGTYYY
jgi:hypothetical protein